MIHIHLLVMVQANGTLFKDTIMSYIYNQVTAANNKLNSVIQNNNSVSATSNDPTSFVKTTPVYNNVTYDWFVFTKTASWIPTFSGSNKIARILVVGGGGAGGGGNPDDSTTGAYQGWSGGGGAGQVNDMWCMIKSGVTYYCTVGAGGASLSNGSQSRFYAMDAYTNTLGPDILGWGGGRGGWYSNGTGFTGACGGGAGDNGQGINNGGSGYANVGYDGGKNITALPGGNFGGAGGGGGNGSVGGDASKNSSTGTHYGGNGGSGVQWIDGVWRGGGGGGSAGSYPSFTAVVGSGGLGGGANGNVGIAGDGSQYTGGGGGGQGANYGRAGHGGSGVIIIALPRI